MHPANDTTWKFSAGANNQSGRANTQRSKKLRAKSQVYGHAYFQVLPKSMRGAKIGALSPEECPLGLCPNCSQEFDLAGVSPSIRERVGNETLLYALCRPCNGQYSKGKEAKRRSISNMCFVNVKLRQRDSDGNLKPWAVTTALTLLLHRGDFGSAFNHGAGVPRDVYLGILNGQYRVDQWAWGEHRRGDV